jgi:hypothetical protein
MMNASGSIGCYNLCLLVTQKHIDISSCSWIVESRLAGIAALIHLHVLVIGSVHNKPSMAMSTHPLMRMN